jgi:hypothetical protein
VSLRFGESKAPEGSSALPVSAAHDPSRAFFGTPHFSGSDAAAGSAELTGSGELVPLRNQDTASGAAGNTATVLAGSLVPLILIGGLILLVLFRRSRERREVIEGEIVESERAEGADGAEFESDDRLISEYGFSDHKSDSHASVTDVSDMFRSGDGSSADFEGQVTVIGDFADEPDGVNPDEGAE